MPSTHALLSPSSSKRWMTCAPSARMESTCPDRTTDYAMEGTLAHRCGEEFLLTYKKLQATGCFDDIVGTINGDPDLCLQYDGLKKEIRSQGYDYTEMFETVHDYYVRPVYEDYLSVKAQDSGAELLVEAQLKLDAFIPGGFGSSDAVIIGGGCVHVYDLKYGKGVKVEAEHNTQMMCYALGAVLGPAELYPCGTVKMTILQPRLQHCSEAALSWDSLLMWAEHVLKPAALKAHEGVGEYVPGDHCKFCKAAPKCRACWLRAKVMQEAMSDPAMLSDEELAQVLGALPSITDWASHVNDYALGRCLSGDGVPGWKAVEGRSLRRITDSSAALAALRGAGFEDDTVCKPKELRTITELEKTVGKKAFSALLGQYVTKGRGKPTLAPESDPRPAYSADAGSDFEGLKL